MRTSHLLLLLSAIAATSAQAGSGCPPFREPAISFAGVKDDDDLSTYTAEILDANEQQFEAFLKCQKRHFDAHWRDYDGNSSDVQDAESEQFMADMRVFNRQLQAAGKSHLALLASQPMKGMYDGSGMASTGGATRTPATSASTPAASRPKPAASQAPQSASPGVPQAPGQYPPIQGCLTARNEPTAGGGERSVITNNCNQPLEANWFDTRGFRNSVTVAPGDSYSGGSAVRLLWACRKNHGITLTSGTAAVCNGR